VKNLVILLSTLETILAAYLTIVRGWFVLVLLAHALFIIYAYSSVLAFKGLGELACFYFETVVVIGSYFVTSGRLSTEAFLPACIPGVFIAMVLWINEFPDVDADRASGKLTLVVRVGRRVASRIYVSCIALAYVLLTLVGIKDPPVLVSLVTIPLSIKSSTIVIKRYEDVEALIPAMRSTILAAILTTVIMSLAFFTSGLLGV